MRKIIYILIALVIIILWRTYPWIITAGGVGNIAIYYLDTDKATFEKKIDSVIKQNSFIGIPDKTIYSLTGTGYEDLNKYIFLIEESDTFIFRYKYSEYVKNWETAPNFRIALTHVGQFPNSNLTINKQLLPFQDNKWEKRFEILLSECKIDYKKE